MNLALNEEAQRKPLRSSISCIVIVHPTPPFAKQYLHRDVISEAAPSTDLEVITSVLLLTTETVGCWNKVATQLVSSDVQRCSYDWSSVATCDKNQHQSGCSTLTKTSV